MSRLHQCLEWATRAETEHERRYWLGQLMVEAAGLRVQA